MQKKTASNNSFLKDIKKKWNGKTYKEVYRVLNERGEEAAREVLNTFTISKKY